MSYIKNILKQAIRSQKKEGEKLLGDFKDAVAKHGGDSKQAREAAAALGQNAGEREAAEKMLKRGGI